MYEIVIVDVVFVYVEVWYYVYVKRIVSRRASKTSFFVVVVDEEMVNEVVCEVF